MIYRFDKVGSTNDVAKGYDAGSVIVASEQSKGRGRFKRGWASPKGGLWMSIVVKPSRRLFEYTFIAALAVLKSVGINASIKWPNDIIFEGKKLCGILSEGVFEGEKIEKFVVGIGMNINNEIPSELRDIAVSLKEVKEEVNIDSLVEKVVMNFKELDKKEFDYILKEYKKNCYMIGKNVAVRGIKGKISGKVVDVSEEGELVLETDEGRAEVGEGDVSIT